MTQKTYMPEQSAHVGGPAETAMQPPLFRQTNASVIMQSI